MVGLLVVALITALAVAAVGDTAPALAKTSVLCAVNEDPCPEEDIYAIEKEEINGAVQAGSAVEVGVPKGWISCSAGKFRMDLSETEGPLVGEETAWTFFKCGPGTCYLEALKTGYSVELEATGGGEGALTVAASNLLVKCFTLLCLYSATPIEFTIEGGNPAHIVAATTMELESGIGGCGEPATLNARYEIVYPGAPLYVSHR